MAPGATWPSSLFSPALAYMFKVWCAFLELALGIQAAEEGGGSVGGRSRASWKVGGCPGVRSPWAGRVPALLSCSQLCAWFVCMAEYGVGEAIGDGTKWV